MIRSLAALALLGAGCAETEATPAAAVVYATAPLAAAPCPVPCAPPPPAVETPVEPSLLPASRVLVLQSTHTDRLTEVVGVVDVHAEMGGHDAALAALRERAAQMGADAVLGVEFHHGHEEGPTHLSGLAVRFIGQIR